ncbi:tyrosine-protein phosphatase [Alkalibacter saccharofermentans]|uniref:protein-tyrosine-phosphatase n=1 Tax=Alkalibacter saccharofermentans DSM 14828 TaxID=1120975 RepID=A0A1M4ZUX0_9FIRM|nr:CpsB/CapC family capsule biosynthesis tyrosine phosphatase [Alkalibacter saccharofermentans]SHF21828.1 protein-tyrosine phosphatase [Alkalibacter saccharofermentans DSM 14828]
MIDIHSHMIYGADKGPKTLRDSLEMAKAAHHAGFTSVVCTPGYLEGSKNLNSLEENKIAFRDIRKALDNSNGAPELYLGSEIYYDLNTVEALEEKKALSLGGSKYVLVKIPSKRMHFPNLLNYVFELEIAGYSIILSNPERCDFILENPNHLASLIKRDVLIQMNLFSISGVYGNGVEKTVKTMLDHNMVHIAATDARSVRDYDDASKALKQLERHVGKDLLEELVFTNPKAIISNEILYPQDPLKVKKKGLLSLIKGIG